MQTFEVALFKYVNSSIPFLTVWHRAVGDEKRAEHDGYVRVSEWVPVDFPPRSDMDLNAEAAKTLQAARDKAAQELAAMDARLAGLKS